MLHDRISNYELEKTTGIKSKYKTPAFYKNEFEYLKEVDSLALANTQLQLQSAYNNFFRRCKNKSGDVGFPKFKNKHSKQSYTTNNQKGTVHFVSDNLIKIPKLKSAIKIKKHRDFDGIIKSTTISLTPTGKYYISLLVDEKKDVAVNNSTGVLGIDMGLSHFAITSTGVKYDNPRFLNNSINGLKTEQKKLSRKKKGSGSYKKQKHIVARKHELITNRRTDFLHKISRNIINENQVGSISIENLNIKGMTSNKKLSIHIIDSSWSKFFELLTYKSTDIGIEVNKVDRYFASSKTCSTCNYKLDKLSLGVRNWTCPVCNTEHDRDINSAINLRDYNINNKINSKTDVLGTRTYVKSSSETIPVGAGVSAKGIPFGV